MTPEEVWRRKSDEEVAAAAQHLDEYTEVGRQVILAEVQRRGLPTTTVEPHRGEEPYEDPTATEGPVETEHQVSDAELQHALEQLRSQQNFPAAVVAGFAGGTVGAIVWAVITVATDYQIGWMAVGVGFLVGFAVRAVGKGIDRSQTPPAKPVA